MKTFRFRPIVDYQLPLSRDWSLLLYLALLEATQKMMSKFSFLAEASKLTESQNAPVCVFDVVILSLTSQFTFNILC